MATRRYPSLVATRVTKAERALIDAAAESRGVRVAELLRKIIIPAVGRMVAGEEDNPPHTGEGDGAGAAA
jgi:hypothetical protein